MISYPSGTSNSGLHATAAPEPCSAAAGLKLPCNQMDAAGTCWSLSSAASTSVDAADLV